MTSSSPVLDPEAARAAALVSLNELRGAFALPPLASSELDAVAARELLEALPLLTMFSALLRATPSAEKLEDVRHNWNKALRRRGWTALPALEARGLGDGARDAALAAPVRELLACFGCELGESVSADSLGLARSLCLGLKREVDALRALPLLAPEQYAARYRSLVERWNALAAERGDLPLIEP